MRFKLKKNLREFNFACRMNKGIVHFRTETNSVNFTNFTPLNFYYHKPFEVYKCVRLCGLPTSTPPLSKLQNL